MNLLLQKKHMKLKKLLLHNFRNYDHAEFIFHPRMNLIYGNNAQGKTNLLEAIYLLSTGRSFRTSHLYELIKDKSPYFYIAAEIEKNDTIEEVKLYFSQQEKKLQINATSYGSFSSLLGLMPSILFTANDQSIIAGAPSERRHFLNLHIAQSDPLYIHHLTRYVRSLKHRNALLKIKATTQFSTWEEEMAKSAIYLYAKRKKMLEEIAIDLDSYMQKLSKEKEHVTLHYLPSFTFEKKQETFHSLLQKSREKDKKFGFTQIGPHRDDFICCINQKNAKIFASEGQKRTALFAIKLAQWKHLCQNTKDTALVQIDDLCLHLDKTRQTLWESSLAHLGQTFITSPEKKEIPIDTGACFTIYQGAIASTSIY